MYKTEPVSLYVAASNSLHHKDLPSLIFLFVRSIPYSLLLDVLELLNCQLIDIEQCEAKMASVWWLVIMHAEDLANTVAGQSS